MTRPLTTIIGQVNTAAFVASDDSRLSDLRRATYALATKTANYTVTTSDDSVMCDATGGAFTVTLPDPATVSAKLVTIKKVDSSVNAVTVTPAAGTIDGSSSRSLSLQYQRMQLQSDGSLWQRVD